MALLVVACTAPADRDVAFVPALHFDSEPSSATFGELRLAGAGDDAALAEADRSLLVERAAAAQSALERAVAVWTGEIELPREGCSHPANQPAVLGEVRVIADRLIFEPRFPWVSGLGYTVCVDTRALSDTLGLAGDNENGRQWLIFALPEAVAPPPQVTAVWPDGDEVPANLLRFYVQFSEPMHRRNVAERVRLLDAQGEPIAEPFVDIPDGLWDPNGQRLTVFLHPGRLKRGVGPREALGPVLRVGEDVALEVDGSLETVRGAPLGETVRRTYRVAEPDRTAPDPGAWRTFPPTGPREPLRLEFDEPLDRAQQATAIRVLRQDAVVPGIAEVGSAGRVWMFTPQEPWHSGSYRVAVRRDLEDLAGNTMDRLFDVATEPARDVDDSAVVQPSPEREETLELAFVIYSADG